MSLNYEMVGVPIAIIDRGNQRPVVISFDDDNEARNSTNEIVVKENENIEYIPNVKVERSICYVAGASGAGKSFFAKEYIKKYLKLFPDNKIYVFSNVSTDPTLDEELSSVLKRIKIHEPAFLDNELSHTDFENSLCLFDDCDAIIDKKLKFSLDKVQNDLLRCGRHSKTSILILSHLIYDGIKTKLVLNESHSITFFKKGVNQKSLRYFLETYMGYEKHQIKQIKRLEGRSITIIKSCPNVIMGSKKIYVIKDDDETDDETPKKNKK